MKKNTIIKRTALMLATVLTMTMAAAVNVSAKAINLDHAIINGINASQNEIAIRGLNVIPQDAANTYINLKYTDNKNEIAIQRIAIDTKLNK